MNGCNQLHFTDCALEVGRRYFYRVVPENGSGPGLAQGAYENVIEAEQRPGAPTAGPFLFTLDGRIQAQFTRDSIDPQSGWVFKLFEMPGMTRGDGICPGDPVPTPEPGDSGWRLTRTLVLDDSAFGDSRQWFFVAEPGTLKRVLLIGEVQNGTWYKLVVTARDHRGENREADDLVGVIKPSAPAAEAGAITDGFAMAGPGYIYLRYKSSADFSTTFIQQGANCSYFMDYPWNDGSQITETWLLDVAQGSYSATVQPGGRTDTQTDWETGTLPVTNRTVTNPLNITNRVGDKMVRLSWAWEGFQDRIFYVERVSRPASATPHPAATDTSLRWELIKEGRENVMRDTGLDNDQVYCYRVIALDPETGALDWEVAKTAMPITEWLKPEPSINTAPVLTATPGNSAVKLVFSPGTARVGLGMQWYSLFHQAGPSAAVETLGTFPPLPNGFTYLHAPLGNGSTHTYWAEVTYDSDEIYQTTPVTVIPEGDLAPFLPEGLRVRHFAPVSGFHRVLLDWEEVSGARAYKVYSKFNGTCSGPYVTSKLYHELQVTTANLAGTTYFVTAVGADGDESQVTGSPCSGGTFVASVDGLNSTPLEATPGDSVQSVVLTVPGGGNILGPTNVTLRASVAISPGTTGNPREVARVEFYANQTLIGKADQMPYAFDWHNPPAGTHSLVAVAVTTAGGRQASAAQTLTVTLRPPLSEFTHSETDFELRGPGGSFPLTRVYRSGDQATHLLGRGWRFNFERAEITTSLLGWSDLGIGWELKAASGGLASLFPQVQESANSNHEIKVTLPDGQDLRFAAVVELGNQQGVPMSQMQFLEHYELFADGSEPAFATLRFVSVDGSDAALSVPDYPEYIDVAKGESTGSGFTLSVVGGFNPSAFVVTLADGSRYEFVPTVTGNKMRLARISDRAGNSFAFELLGSGSSTPLTAGESWLTESVKRIAIKAQKLNTDGSYATVRECWVDDVLATSNAEWTLFDPVVTAPIVGNPAQTPGWGTVAGQPIVRYVTSSSLLTEVRKLNNRLTATVDTHRYEYTNFQSQDLLETVKSPEGVILLKNTYALVNGLVGLDFQEDALGIKRDYSYPAGSSGTLSVPVKQGTTTLVTESLDYSADGLITKTESGGQTVENSYDERGRLAYSAVQVTGTSTVIPTTYDYDRQDRPVQVMDGQGNATRFEYTADSQPAKVTDARQNSTSYDYYSDSWGVLAGKLQRTVDAAGNATEYDYNVRGQIVSEVRRLKDQSTPLITRYEYYEDEDNASGNGRIGDLRRVYHPLSSYCTTSFQAFPVALPAYATEYTYDANGNRLTEKSTRTTRFVTVGEQLRTETVTSASTYDPQGRVSTSDRTRSWNIGLPPANDVGQSSTQYDALGRAKVTTDGYNRQTTSTYDVRGNLIETLYPDGSVSRTIYDALGRATMVQDRAMPSSGVTTASANETQYDDYGRVRFTRRRTDVQVSKVADTGYLGYLAGNPVQYRTQLDNPGTVFSITRTEYDGAGRVRHQVSPLGVLTETFYDSLGRRERVRVYDNYVCPLDTTAIPASPSATYYDTTYGYDEVGNVVWTRDPRGNVSGSLHWRTDTVYDELNRVVRVTLPGPNPDARPYRRTTYDSLGRVTAEIAEDGIITARRYDLMGRLTDVFNDYKSGVADTHATQTRTQFGYDEVGNQITQTDAENRVTRYEYDWLGRRTYRALPGADLTTANMVESAVYASVNAPGSTNIKVMQRSVTDFAGKVTTFTHDKLDRLATEQRQQIQITATPNNITVTTDRLLKHEYDPQGRRWRVQEFEGTSDTGTQLRDERYGYDKLGRLRVKAVPEGTLTYEYDVGGNPTLISARRSYALPVNAPFAFETVQASAATVSTTTAPNAGEMVYRYDTLGRLWKVNPDTVPPVANTPADVTYAYDANGSLATQTYRNNVATAYTYNERNQLRLVRSTVSGALRATFDYDGADTATHLATFAADRGLSPTGQRRQLSEKIGSVTNTIKYNYDALRRLTIEDRSGATGLPSGVPRAVVDFTSPNSNAGYDKVGNRRTKKVDAGGTVTTTTLAYSALDRVTSGGFSFDAKGNTLTADLNGDGDSADANEPSPTTNQGDRYDSLNRLVWAKRGNNTIELTYDSDGNRVSKTVTPAAGVPVTTLYLVDTVNPTGYAQVLAETPVTAPAPLNVVGEWRFDQRSGTQATDTSGNNRHGTLTGSPLPKWTAGVASNGLTFATGGSVSVPDQAALRLGASGASFSIAFWVRKDAEPTQAVRLVGKGTSATANYGVWEEAGGKRVYLEFRRASDNTLQTAYSTANLEVGRWYHVACTYNGSVAKVYVNGIKNSEPSLTGTPVTGTEALTFGAGPTGDTLPGALDEVRIYSRVLVDSEVAQLAGMPATRYTYGLDLVRQDRGPALTGGAVETRYFGYDGLGSVRHLTDTAGTTTDTYYYDAFGLMAARYARRTSDGAMLAFANPATETGPAGTTPVVNNYRYAGEQWDGDLGLYYNRARYYAPELGRFWSMDSYEGSQGDPLSLHKYLYCHANPVNGVDPSGHEFSIGGLSSAISGGLNTLRISGGAIVKRYAMRKLANVGVSAVLGGLYGGALEATGGGDFFGEGMVNGAKWGAIFGSVPKAAWGTDLGRMLLIAFAAQAAKDGINAYDNDHPMQALLYFLGGGLAFRGAVTESTVPNTLYKFIPAHVDIGKVKSEGLRVGAERSAWATSMEPSKFSQWLIGGPWARNPDTLKFFSQDFVNGWVAIIRNTKSFKPSNTYWKAFTGQYEAEATVPPKAFEIVPFSEATKK